MRVKLNFLFEQKVDMVNDHSRMYFNDVKILKEVKKIIFPINLKEMTTVADLKFLINSFLVKKGVKSMCVESLLMESFALLDEFELSLVVNNDDEIM